MQGLFKRINTMREFKFKVWDKRGKQMYTVSDIFSYGVGVAEAIDEDGGNILYEEYELLQFIGLKDEKDKEIFDGHIVKRFCPCGKCDHFWIGVITWRESATGFIYRDFVNQVDSPIEMFEEDNEKPAILEIIGNIYENPELIK